MVGRRPGDDVILYSRILFERLSHFCWKQSNDHWKEKKSRTWSDVWELGEWCGLIIVRNQHREEDW